MWLINTTSLRLESFHGDATPAYAILSHTWGSNEVSLQDFTSAGPDGVRAAAAHHAGYRKIVAAVHQARQDGHGHIWIDTCCIDKTSSAELTEVINSMYAWYSAAQTCYAYLSDTTVSGADAGSSDDFEARLRRCRWFTRGWCLQELLAPRRIRFFNDRWCEIGTKASLCGLLARISGVPEAVLASPPERDVGDFPVAQRISWIAGRQTTRVEDMAYSLLGILDINMPMLYGEGSKAFARLQEEIIRKYNDLSIFAWSKKAKGSGFIPVLAPSPDCFKREVLGDKYHDGDDGDFVDEPDTRQSASLIGDRLRTQFSLTNQGVVFPNVKLYCQNPVAGYRYHYLLLLNYRDDAFRGIRDKQWYILLQKVGPGLYARIHETGSRTAAFRDKPILDPFYEPVCIINNISPTLARQLATWERHAVRLRWRAWEKRDRKFWNIRAMEPRQSWDVIGGQFLVEMASEQYLHIEFVPGNHETNPHYEYFVIVVVVGSAEGRRDPSRISARIVSSRIWPGANATPFQFASKEVLALQSLPAKTGGGPERLSLVGYDMWLTVSLNWQHDGVPYHLIYLDWEESAPEVYSRRLIRR
ncbi:hypothetical protein K4F52_002482 [Lecanicillium sp. MT-2017a]|nr:hypothetical protein K4F52_002482 [Lecanicillium sp. MT-2017a]